MARVKLPNLLLLALAGLAVPAHAEPTVGQDAWNLLRKSMEKGRFVAADALILRRENPHSSFVELKLLQAGDGRMRLLVLAPLEMQGITSVDDGHQWMTLLPDDHRLIVQGSPKRAEDPMMRIKLAEQNYDLQMGKPAKIAGRHAYALVAVPKSPEMPQRRYYIDTQQNFILRAQVGKRIDLDTKAIRFNPDIDSDQFDLTTPPEVRVESHLPPRHLDLAHFEKGSLGFTPVLPHGLPYGFSVQEPQMCGERKCHYVAVRITDGLANATVYQWKRGAKPWPSDPRAREREAKGIKMRLVGDVPEVVLVKLLDSFIKEAMRQAGPLFLTLSDGSGTETKPAGQALNSEQRRSWREEADEEDLSLESSDGVIIAFIEIVQ